MFYRRDILYIFLFHSIIAGPQLNLYYTDWINDSQNENDTALQHNCFHVPVSTLYRWKNYEIVTYCLSEFPSRFNVTNNDYSSKFTFNELSKENISSEHLYNWSAPIDIIERYQFYLNQLSTPKSDSSLGEQIYYNCTLPRFGSQCQYQLYYFDSRLFPLDRMISYFYTKIRPDSTNLSCYEHLQCLRGPSPSCLDWSEICDGKVDCLDGNFDEEHCWQLEMNLCKDDEYRCKNGQCIPQSFYHNEEGNLDCIDGSDINQMYRYNNRYKCIRGSPSFICDDLKCESTYLTSSCSPNRRELLLEAMYSMKDQSVHEDCWSTLKCMFFVLQSKFTSCYNFCEENSCVEIIEDTCPEMFFFPNVPVLFGQIYFAFQKSNSTNEDNGLLYICSNNSAYDAFFDITTIRLFNNTRCFLHHTISYRWNRLNLWAEADNRSLQLLYNQLQKCQLIYDYNSTICNRSSMYQCLNSSKCISIHRLIDNIYDCPYLDDETKFEMNNPDIIKQFERSHYQCQTSKKYIPKTLIKKGSCDCDYIGYEWCYDQMKGYQYEKNLSFHRICDGFVESTPIIINEQNQTDETECEQWECDNIYTHCDGIWNCPRGKDELNCSFRPSSNCSFDDHICVSPQTNQFICLSNEKINDGRIDCLGAYDETEICHKKPMNDWQWDNFYCIINQTNQSCIAPSELCNTIRNCDNGDDEQFCKPNRTRFDGVCWDLDSPSISDTERFLCFHSKRQGKQRQTPPLRKKINALNPDLSRNIENPIISSSSENHPHCLRGLDLRVWSGNKSRMTCFCPPSSYGSQCQYQNQRITLSIQFLALSQSYRTLFAIIISLIDDSDQRIVHSVVQISFISIRDCQNKYGFYLVYSTQPKDSRKTYFIHIDIYEKEKLDNYRGSLLFPIQFPFLPVYRLAFIVNITKKTEQIPSCSKIRCDHGKCIKYSNILEERTFCQCNKGWSGRYCHIQFNCTCSSDSICIGISANHQSICVCPLHKFGSRCLLTNSPCNSSLICHNGGQCIPEDNDMRVEQSIECICPDGYSGPQCQITDGKLSLSFDKDINVFQSILIHFFNLNDRKNPKLLTRFQPIVTKQDSMTIYWSQPFDLVFTELLNKNYYLIVNEKINNRSIPIEKLIKPSDRCRDINEVFNQTILQLDLIRRIKYYHLPCQIYSSDLNCFYDQFHLCLCYNLSEKRLSDCLEFNHNMIYDCIGQSECENGGQCFQENKYTSQITDGSSSCQSRSMCICSECYYGRRCQFSTSGFSLSLDTILGYHIIPNVNIENQSSIIKFSFSLTIILIFIGLIDGLICIITFKNKIIREVGCGLYLLTSSITTLLTMIIFGLKFFILLLTQMRNPSSNESFLLFQCQSIDFLLRICLSMDQWLNACVAVERTMVIIKGPNFIKKKSQKAAKIVIVILLILISVSYIHDPIYRRLIDEQEDDSSQKRIWCIVSYPTSLEVYNYIIHILHFFGPFSINLISSIMLIIKAIHQQSNLHKNRPYKQILKEQVRLHKQLLIAPIVLVFLSLPRLIITFASKCMKSADDAWLYLIGYFISFIPSIINSIVFILPSEFYRKECQRTLLQYRSNIERHLHLIR